MEATDEQKSKHEERKKTIQPSEIQAIEKEEDPLKTADYLMAIGEDRACAFLDLMHPVIGNTLIVILGNRAWVGKQPAVKILMLATALKVRAAVTNSQIEVERRELTDEANQGEEEAG